MDRDKLTTYLVAFTLLSFPFSLIYQTILYCILALYAFIFGTFSFTTFKKFTPLIFFYVLLLISLTWSIDLSHSLEKFPKYTPFLLTPFIFSFIPLKSKQINSTFNVYSLGIFIWAIFFILHAYTRYIESENISVFFHHDLVLVLDLNRIYVSAYAFVAVIWLVAKKEKNKLTWLQIVVIGLFIFLLSSKSYIIQFVLFTTIILFFIKRRSAFSKRIALIITSFSVLLGCFYLVNNINQGRLISELNIDQKVLSENKRIGPGYYANGITLRLLYAKFLYELIEEEKVNPLSGTGISTSQFLLNEKINQYEMYPGYVKYNYHNQFIQTFSEIGIFGVIILLSTFMLAFYLSIKTNNQLFFCFVFFSFFILFFSESFLYRQRGLLLFVFIYSILTRNNCCWKMATSPKIVTN